MDSFTQTIVSILAVMGVVIVILVIKMIHDFRQFKWRFTVKELVNGRIKRDTVKAREYNLDGLTVLKLKGRRYKGIFAPLPPEEAIELDCKGRNSVEAYFTPNKEFCYSKDGVLLLDGNRLGKKVIEDLDVEYVKTEKLLVPKEEYLQLTDKQRKDLFKDGKVPAELQTEVRRMTVSKFIYLEDNGGSVNTIEPLTTNQRSLLIDQEEKARKDMGFSWKEHILQIALISVILFLCVLGYLAFDSYNEHNAEISKGQMEVTQQQGAFMQQLGKYLDTGERVQIVPASPKPSGVAPQ